MVVMNRVGDIALTAVHDADIHLRTEELFREWDEHAVAPYAAALGPRYFDHGVHTLPVHCWLVRTGTTTILVDTGCGDDKERPDLPELHRLRTGFLGRLRAAGVAPEDVDVVLCTHLHVDHAGWNTRLADGRWVPTFPRARYVVSAVELAHITALAADQKSPRLMRDLFADSVLPIVAAGQIETTAGEHELAPGVTVRPAPGHTPGHVQVELRSRGERAVLSGDILHTPLQGPFWSWRIVLAGDPEQDVRTRRALLETCAENGALLIPAHFHLPGVGRVRADGERFAIALGW
jgi:glyoxylase-like metal-dependent hydrolase (beta-lactamase superfamily II)